jgi:hypothetical protein
MNIDRCNPFEPPGPDTEIGNGQLCARAAGVRRTFLARVGLRPAGVHCETCGFNHVLTMKKWGFTMKHGGFIVDIADL